MLFGKKRGLATLSRTASRQAQALTAAEVLDIKCDASATLQLEEENVASVQDDISQIAGDPIQQLFTTLGKFHRHLNKIQHSSAGEEWCDDCMNELMAGLEISIACDWTPVKDALIDAARILHSYELSGKASLCVPFLQNSYELLSLMVGDLIVDKVRDGVKQKWREHYMRAIDELEARGIELVDDDTREVVAGYAPAPGAPVAPPDNMTPTTKVDNRNVAQNACSPSNAFKEANAPREQRDQEMPKVASHKFSAELDSMEFNLPALPADFGTEKADRKTEGDGDIIPFPAISSEDKKNPDEAPEEATVLENSVKGAEGQISNDLFQANETDSDNGIVPEKKFADSALSTEQETMPDTTVKNAGMKETAQKKTDAGETAQDIKTEEDGANKTAEETASKDEAVQNITSDITSEKKPVTEIPSSETFQHKAAAKFEEEVSLKTETKPPPDVIREQKKEEAPLQEDADSPMTLLQRAQQAVTAGDTRNTKAIALELAAAMARLEYEQARQNLATAEQDLLKNGRIIEQSEATVAQKENDLLRAEELLAARDSERNACRERINMIDEELSVMTSERADIDAQIAVLQQKRKEQLNRIENKQTEREEAIDTESRAQTDLEALAQETESIRDRLMEARSETRNEYAARRVIELDIVQAQEEMESRRLALEAIERTLNPEGNTRPKIEESDSLL